MKLNELILVAQNIEHLTGIRSYIIAADESILYEPEGTEYWDFIFEDKKGISHNLIAYFRKDGRPDMAVIETDLFESYLAVRIVENGSFQGLIFTGPVMPRDFDSKELYEALYRYGIAADQQKYVRYLEGIPVYSFRELAGLGAFFYTALYGKRPDIEQIIGSIYKMKDNFYQESVREKRRLSRKAERSPEYTMQYENELCDAIQHGEPERIDGIWKSIASIDASELAAGDTLRSLKNKAIALTTVASRSAVRGGLDLESAFAASDHYIVMIENMATADQVIRSMPEMCREYAENIRNVNKNAYSPLASRALQFIRNHVFDRITVEDVSDHMQFSSGYLEAQIKKETGSSVHRWIALAKLDEAEKMLKYTDYSLSEIAVILGYTDQSHFSKAFKNEKGISPFRFRKQNHSI